MPAGWAGALEQYAFDMRITRAELVRRTVADWLKKHPEFSSMENAAAARNSSLGQMMRQIMEDELPTLCPPIQEWRGDGARHAEAIRKGRLKKRMIGTVTINVHPHHMALFKQLAKAKPELYPDAEAVVTALVSKWADAQAAKQEQSNASASQK
jgi:hypothetical protein